MWVFKYPLSSLTDNDAETFKTTASHYIQARLTFQRDRDISSKVLFYDYNLLYWLKILKAS